MSFSIFEALMLVCFGVSWPVSIYRSAKSRTAKGKSLVFLVLLALAYTAGILHKVFVRFDIVILLYSANFIMIMIDIALYIRNSRLDALRQDSLRGNDEKEIPSAL